MTGELEQLAELVRAKNEADLSIARLLGRPALSGNIGEFVAARVFGIDLMQSGSHAGYDGVSARRHSRGRPSTSRRTAVTSGSWTLASIPVTITWY